MNNEAVSSRLIGPRHVITSCDELLVKVTTLHCERGGHSLHCSSFAEVQFEYELSEREKQEETGITQWISNLHLEPSNPSSCSELLMKITTLLLLILFSGKISQIITRALFHNVEKPGT